MAMAKLETLPKMCVSFVAKGKEENVFQMKTRQEQ